MDDDTRDHGPQPLSAIMERWGLDGHDLVEASPEQLNHKQVQRAKTGRQLTLNMMMKVARALNLAIRGRLKKEQNEAFVDYIHKDLFSYSKGYNPAKADPNADLGK